MDPTVEIRKVCPSDLDLLYEISRRAYAENFAHHWNEGGLEWYLNHTYSRELLETDLKNDNIHFYMVIVGQTPAGFMKVNLDSIFPKHASIPSIEIEKIYIRPDFQKSGFGRDLLNKAVQLARDNGTKRIWLAVIDTNTPAIDFYKKAGFEIFDTIRLDLPYFKDELRGMFRMVLKT